jgi:DNA photolyase
MTNAPVVVWYRQDLRVRDQAALAAAADTGRPVVPLYVLDDISPGTVDVEIGRRQPLVAARTRHRSPAVGVTRPHTPASSTSVHRARSLTLGVTTSAADYRNRTASKQIHSSPVGGIGSRFVGSRRALRPRLSVPDHWPCECSPKRAGRVCAATEQIICRDPLDSHLARRRFTTVWQTIPTAYFTPFSQSLLDLH